MTHANHRAAFDTPLSRRILLGIGAAASGGALLSACGASDDEVTTISTALRRPLRTDAPDPAPEIVRYATLAANSHNTQPWLFRRSVAGLRIRPDFSRRTPAVDPDDHHLFVSLGCASENMALAAGAFGRRASVAFDPAQRAIEIGLESAPIETSPLLPMIARRQSTRSAYEPRALPPHVVAALEDSVRAIEGVRLVLLTARREIARVRDFVIEANRLQMADAAFVRELREWLRFDAARALRTRDGLFSAASGNPTLYDPLGRLIFPYVFTEAREAERYRTQIDSSSAVALFIADRADEAHWIQIGRACQRFALTATLLDMKHAYVNPPVEVSAIRPQFSLAFGLGEARVDLVLRLGYAPALPYSLRRPIEAVWES
jgi:predicted RNA methylase